MCPPSEARRSPAPCHRRSPARRSRWPRTRAALPVPRRDPRRPGRRCRPSGPGSLGRSPAWSPAHDGPASAAGDPPDGSRRRVTTRRGCPALSVIRSARPRRSEASVPRRRRCRRRRRPGRPWRSRSRKRDVEARDSSFRRADLSGDRALGVRAVTAHIGAYGPLAVASRGGVNQVSAARGRALSLSRVTCSASVQALDHHRVLPGNWHPEIQPTSWPPPTNLAHEGWRVPQPAGALSAALPGNRAAPVKALVHRSRRITLRPKAVRVAEGRPADHSGDPQPHLVRCLRSGGLVPKRLREHLIGGVRGRPPAPPSSGAGPPCVAASKGVTSLRPLRPCGRRSSGRLVVVNLRCAASRRALGGWAWWGCRSERPVETTEPRRSALPQPRASRPTGGGGCVADLWGPVHPVHVLYPTVRACKRLDWGARRRSRSIITMALPQLRVNDPERVSFAQTPSSHDRGGFPDTQHATEPQDPGLGRWRCRTGLYGWMHQTRDRPPV